jgi:hypothetical protein
VRPVRSATPNSLRWSASSRVLSGLIHMNRGR